MNKKINNRRSKVAIIECRSSSSRMIWVIREQYMLKLTRRTS